MIQYIAITTDWFVSAVIASCMGCGLSSLRQAVILTSWCLSP